MEQVATAHTATATAPHDHDHDYSALLIGVRASFDAAARSGAALFLTDVDGLNELYLDSLPSERQVHNCHCCRRFIGTYGGLVAIMDAGETIPVMWNPDVPDFYRPAFAAMYARVKRARVTSVFLSKETTWGNPVTGDWSHISVVPPAALVYREGALTAGQAMAAAKENLRTVATALSAFTAPMLDQALRLFEGDTLARSEKFIGPVKWLRALQDRPKGRLGENMLWRAVALAPEGYCHPKASVIGPLLDDIAAGLPFQEIKAKFDAKMAPLLYQRPQGAPSAGNIKAAEALAEKMGIAPALERRFARLDELRTIWTPDEPRDASAPAGGVFAHLKPKDAAGAVRPIDMPAITMTWDKFNRTILDGAEQMEILIPSAGRFIALTTAVHAAAPPLLKWDRDDERNPVAWYVYPHGSPAQQWGLTPHAWAKVNAIVPFPNVWGSKPMPFIGDGVVLVIEGAIDTRTDCGNALFPETLREEMHAVRSTIEAYSKSAVLGGRAEASACGYDVRKSAADCSLRVRVGSAWTAYRIDRWD